MMNAAKASSLLAKQSLGGQPRQISQTFSSKIAIATMGSYFS
jgi:hypothetical protein